MAFDIDRAAAALRALVFEDDPALLTPELLNLLHLDSWQFPLLDDRSAEAQARYRSAFATDLTQLGMLKQIDQLFAKHHLRWCPIKGADLAWRVWPKKLVRFKGDLDVLIHPDDREQACQLLKSAGWDAKFHYDHPFHEAMMWRHGVALELHFGLPEFEKADMRELWKDFIPLGDGKFRLPLELNLVLLFAHSRSHSWSNGVPLLLDCGFLIRNEGAPDWEKINGFARVGQTASPALFFCAFPDFFPAESIPAERFSEEGKSAFRQLILTPHTKNSVEEKVMAAGNRYSWTWWLDRFRAMSPNAIRHLTDNPQGHYGKLLAGYWTVTLRKIRGFWQYRHGSGDLQLRQRLRNSESIESMLKERYGK